MIFERDPMKTLFTATASLLLAHSALAGNYGSSYGQMPTPPPALSNSSSCGCFAAGTQGISLYGALLLGAEAFDNSFGAGAAYSLFPSEYWGVEADATWGFADSTIHTFNASAIVRYPIRDLCLAPYALIGAGIHTDGVKQGTWHIGAGVDIRLTPECLGMFLDARYVFAEETGNYTLIRSGVRWSF